MTRAIAVDLRYMLWYMSVVDQAHELLAEMGMATHATASLRYEF